VHYSFGPHSGPWPQWPTGPKPSQLAHGDGLWPTHALNAWLERGHRAMRDQRTRRGTVLDGAAVTYHR
jgi:hypothetical protein